MNITCLNTDVIGLVSKFLPVAEAHNLISICKELYSEQEYIVKMRVSDLIKNSLYKISLPTPTNYIDYQNYYKKLSGLSEGMKIEKLFQWSMIKNPTTMSKYILSSSADKKINMRGKLKVSLFYNKKTYIAIRATRNFKIPLELKFKLTSETNDVVINTSPSIDVGPLGKKKSKDGWHWIILGSVISSLTNEADINFEISDNNENNNFTGGISFDRLTAFSENQLRNITSDDSWIINGYAAENRNCCPCAFHNSKDDSEAILRKILTSDFIEKSEYNSSKIQFMNCKIVYPERYDEIIERALENYRNPFILGLQRQNGENFPPLERQ